MKNPGKNKDKKAGIRLSVPLLIVLLVLIASVLIIYSTPVLTEEKRTSGNLTFTDSAGIPVSGTIEISMAGAPSGERSNVNSITWRNAPNAWLYFDAYEAKNISINLRISGDSPNGMVSLEDHGAAMPESVDVPVPGIPVKYVELHSTGVSFADADISIYYTDAELKGLDETGLVIYIYDGGAWNELPTRVDAAKNVVSAAVVSLSIFAVSARVNEDEINKFRNLINPPEVKEHLESDALKTKGVAVKLTINKRGNGQIKLEDHGKKNPVAIAPPGKSIKFVDISAEDIGFDSAEVRIHYTDEELGNGDESALIIYHWNGGAWDALETSVDAENNILTAVTTSLSPFAVSWGEGGAAQILVATNRFVILDEPRTPFGLGTGFIAPGTGNDYNSATNYWDGAATTINATSMYLRSNGTPVSSKQINFTIYWPNGTVYGTTQKTTDSNGLANASWDLNNKPFYGNWTIKAEANGNFKNTTFIYNWWGCVEWGGISGCNRVHTSKNPSEKGTATRNSPYSKGAWDPLTSERDSKSNYKCTICHTLYDGKLFSSRNEGLLTENTTDVHRNVAGGCRNASCHGNYYQHGIKGVAGPLNQLVASCYNTTGGCHTPRLADVSSKSTLSSSTVATALSLYSINSTSFNSTFHTPNSTIPCIICHGPMHNITKPDEIQRFERNSNTESEHCTACHSNYNKHNNTVNCTLCHSDDVHYIQVFAANSTGGAMYMNTTNQSRGNCTLCHQNGSAFFNSLKSDLKAGDYAGRNPPQVAVPLKHSNDSSAGKKWNTTTGYWTSGTDGSAQLSSCKYCHGETNHKTAALGRPSLWRGNNVVNSTLGNTTWCAGCHWQGYASGTNTSSDMINTFTGDNLLVPPEISGNATYGANQSIYEYTNHSLYTNFYSNLNDSACNRCHGYKYGFTTITQLVHNQSRVGGRNCVECHDIGGIALVAHVNVTTSNDTNAIHKNLNSIASVTNSTPFYANNKRCWTCHGDGDVTESVQPSDRHPARYKTPYLCRKCHADGEEHTIDFISRCLICHPVAGDKRYAVYRHYNNSPIIMTPAASSCYDCHNKSEMMLPANDPDNGSGAVYGGVNGGNNSTNHYGRKRDDLRIGGSANCSYCHQNISTAFASAMIDPAYNGSISNHSMRYNSSNPGCTSSQCHKTGLIHGDTLAKPSLTLPSSAYCSNCHGSSGSATIKNLAKHNGAVDCTRCHLNTSRDIHPAKYLQSNASYSTGNSTAVNCINCHQTGLTGFSNSPMVPMPLRHSENTSNGTLWNSTAYWTPTNPLTSCIYCHNDTKHNATALGRPANWKGNNIVNSSLSTGTWCASCHYRNYSNGGKNYSDMTWAFTLANLPVPPEITNGSYAVNIYNRSNYYNHSLKNYSDAVCILCHGANLSSTSGVSAFLHNISWGSCTSCHYSFEAMNNTTRPDRYVDSGMYNTSLHRSLSCTNCHTQGHRNIGARKACEDCHAVQADPVTDKDRHNITATPSTYSVGGNNVVGITDCTVCHDSDLYNRSISTYGYWKPKDCDYCHTYPDKYYE